VAHQAGTAKDEAGSGGKIVSERVAEGIDQVGEGIVLGDVKMLDSNSEMAIGNSPEMRRNRGEEDSYH